MLDFDYFYSQWVGSGGESDHNPIFLKILNRGIKLISPFKFNPHWLESDELVKLLNETWVVYSDNLQTSPTNQFYSNLKRNKDVSIAWSVKKSVVENKDLVAIESLLIESFNKLGFGFSSEQDKSYLVDLETRKRKILYDRE